MRKTVRFSSILLIMLLAVSFTAMADHRGLRAVLDGSQENPPTGSSNSGSCTFQVVDGNDLVIACTHDVAAPTGGHIHAAAIGMNGGVVFPFSSPASPINQTWSGLSEANLAALEAGGLYVNIHTAANPGGEIRGQIIPTDYVADADGSQENPPSGSSNTGSCLFDLDGSDLKVLCVHDVAAPTAAHIHNAPIGTNGGVVFPFSSPTSPISQTWSGLSAADIANLQSGNFYVNIHTAANPGGEIRGQIAAGAPVPTLSQWGLIALAALLGGGAFFILRRRG